MTQLQKPATAAHSPLLEIGPIRVASSSRRRLLRAIYSAGMAGLPLGMAPYAHANNDAGASATTLLLGRLLPRSAAAFASMAEQRAG